MAEENEIYTADDRLIVALDVDSVDTTRSAWSSTTVQAVIRSAT